MKQAFFVIQPVPWLSRRAMKKPPSYLRQANTGDYTLHCGSLNDRNAAGMASDLVQRLLVASIFKLDVPFVFYCLILV